MSTPSDADVPLIHASFTCTETTADEMVKDLRSQGLRRPRSWIIFGISCTLVASAYALNVRVLGQGDWTAVLLSFPVLLFLTIIATSLMMSMIKTSAPRRAFAVEFPPGAVLRAEFGTHGFTVRIQRGTFSYRYTELLPVLVGKHVVVMRLRHQPSNTFARPLGLFPDAALALIEPHTKIRRKP